jgi:hypothetical protein
VKPSIPAAVVGGIFFPQSRELGIDPGDTVSPGLLKKIVHAGTQATSFRQASSDLRELAEAEVSTERVWRATERIGKERVGQRQAELAAYAKLPFSDRDRSPTGQVPPVACVQADGGRIQLRNPPLVPSTSAGRSGRFWRETKVACLLSMSSTTHASDPCPELPEMYRNFVHMARLTREIAGAAPLAEEPPQKDRCEEEEANPRPGRPEVLVRSVVATRRPLPEFGPLVAAAAWRRGFAAAERKAFLGDGAAANWSLHKEHFSHYTPILDFLHAMTYVFRGATAGRGLDDAVAVYLRWAQAVWSGRVADVIDELKIRHAELGPPLDTDSDTAPRSIVAESLRYLQNQADRMDYAEYRRQGLPITSAHIESTIKQINRRVKGSEKFWNEAGAEALLQLAADNLSDTHPLDAFWRDRPHRASGRRRYIRS